MTNNTTKIIALLLTVISVYTATAQTEWTYPAPKGILVFMGKKIPNGKIVQSIAIQRKEDAGNFSALTEVKCVASETEFITKSNDWKKYFPDLAYPTDSVLKVIWARATRFSLLDSCGGWAYHPAVRIALGLVYYDLTAKENARYQYKISFRGGVAEEVTSGVTTFPLHPKFDEITLESYTYSKEGLYLRFKSVGKNKPAEYKIFRYDDTKKATEVKAIHGDYSVRDTNYFVIQDKSVAAGKTYQYTLVGTDKFGNTAYGSTPAIVSTTNFNAFYFKKTGADKLKDRLGIKLNWKLSDISNVASVHVFKSSDAVKGFKEIGVTRAQDTTFVDEQITPDKAYFYYLEVKDKTQTQSKRSSTFFDFGLDVQAPLTPEIYSASSIKGGVKLSAFVPDAFVAGYKVFRAAYNDSIYKCIAPFVSKHPDSSSVVYLDTSKELSGKTVYNYYIVSQNTSNLSSQASNIQQAHPNVPVMLAAPASLNAYFQDGYIHLNWENMQLTDETIEGYVLYKKESSQKEFEKVFGKDSVHPGSFYSDLKFEEGKTYEYEVQVVDMFGNRSSNRATAKVTTPEDKPVPPAGPRAMALPDGIRLEWDGTNPEDITGYKLYRYQRGGSALLLTSPAKTETGFTDTSAKNGELYFYYLTSVDNKKRESEPSAEVGIRK